VLQIVRGLPRASGLEIDADVDPAVPAWLRGDEARLSQILINLMSNAVKFTEHGSVSLRVSVSAPGASSDTTQPLWVSFSVRDTGLGIASAMQSQIFEPYVQVGGRMITPQKGTGLGLAICRQLATMMQGELTLQSEVGAGANFTLNVPLMRGDSSAMAIQETDASDGRRLDVLVAEDTPASQLVIQLMLERMGHRVTVVGDGLQAVEAFRKQRFDLILMDVQMPEMDGYEAARAIRQLSPDDVVAGALDGQSVPIVGLSAFALASNQVAGLQSGMNAYLTKPVQTGSLERIIAEVTALPGRRVNPV
jgi:CheY-like chemotaxis protein